MDRRDVRQGIRRAWDIVDQLELGATFSNEVPLAVDETFRDLVLAESSEYRAIYLAGLDLSHYNFMLQDFAFFQFSCSSTDHVRYAYYPNPFAEGRKGSLKDFGRWRDLVAGGLITHEEYLTLMDDEAGEMRIPLIRYENAPTQHKGLSHPCSHFHIGHHADNRWAANRVLTPAAFTLLVLKYYYGSLWRHGGGDGEGANRLEAQLIAEKARCRRIPETLFSAQEASSFFFS